MYLANAGVALIAVLLFVQSYACCSEDVNPTAILWCAMGVADVITDMFLLFNLVGLQLYFVIFMVMKLVSLASNILIWYYTLIRQIESSVVFWQWQLDNFYTFRILLLFACLDINFLSVIESGLCWAVTTGSLSPRTRQSIKLATCISVLIENLPQLGLQVYVLLSQDQKSAGLLESLRVASILSILEIMTTLVGILFSYDMEADKSSWIVNEPILNSESASCRTVESNVSWKSLGSMDAVGGDYSQRYTDNYFPINKGRDADGSGVPQELL